MVIPLIVVDRGELIPPGLTEKLRLRTQRLAHFFESVKECRLNVDGPGQHPLPNRVRVRLYLSVPGTEIAITHQGGDDLSIALRSAFDAADRRLETYARHVRSSRKASDRGPKRKAN
jgi:hypothetical protein